jgi:splicing factor 3A subunit 1
MLPPLHYQGLDAAQPFGYSPPLNGNGNGNGVGAGGMGVSSRQAALAAANAQAQQVQAGMVRTADQMLVDGEGVPVPDDVMPPAKRQRVAKLPGGALYPESDWIAMHPHPISLQVQLPNDASRPELKLDGSVVLVPDLPMTLLVSTLRDRIKAATGRALSASKMRISYLGKMLTNSTTIGAYNLEDEDLIVLSLSDGKKK